jgi:hypothetical protein
VRWTVETVKSTFSLVEILKMVETAGDEVVPGTCRQDVRDAVVILAGKVSKCKRLPNWHKPPSWTMREAWAADLVIRALGATLARCADGHGSSTR